MLGIQKYKNIEEIQLKPPKTWNHIESLSINERLTIGVIAKYQLVKEKERLVNYITNYFGLEPKNIDPDDEVQSLENNLRAKEETKDED
jgi:hypothetical protein